MELIDSKGCPTDPAIMGPLRRIQSNNPSKIYEAPFEAFKFPTSAIVQFRALIVPCIQGDCHPVLCTISSSYSSSSNINGIPTFSNGLKTNIYSYGRRKRDANGMKLTLRSLIGGNHSTNGNGDQLQLVDNDQIIMDESDLLTLPLKEVEERVFIEVVEKRVKITSNGESNETSNNYTNEEGRKTTGSFETTSYSDDFIPSSEEMAIPEVVVNDKLTTGQIQTTTNDQNVSSTTRKPSRIVTKNRNHRNYRNQTKVSKVANDNGYEVMSRASGSRRSDRAENDNGLIEDCFSIPIPYLVASLIMLMIQLILLIRYFVSTKRMTSNAVGLSSNTSYASSFRPMNPSVVSSSSYARSLAFSMKLGDN